MGCLQQIITPANPCLTSTPCEQYTSSDCVRISGTLNCLTGVNPTLTSALTQICAALQTNAVTTVTVTISSAQILNSFTTPITLLPAPGVGYQWQVVSVQGYYNYSTAVYVSGGGAGFGLTQGDISYLIDGGASNLNGILTTSTTTGQFKLRLGAQPNGSNALSLYNQPVKFYSTTANPTVGGGSLILTITAIKTL